MVKWIWGKFRPLCKISLMRLNDGVEALCRHISRFDKWEARRGRFEDFHKSSVLKLIKNSLMI